MNSKNLMIASSIVTGLLGFAASFLANTHRQYHLNNSKLICIIVTYKLPLI